MKTLRKKMASPTFPEPQWYFAYGMNMNLGHMGRLVPAARPAGVGLLTGYRFGIAAHGYATVIPDATGVVPGVLFRLTEDDLGTLDTFEGVNEGLYKRASVPVRSMVIRRGDVEEVYACAVYWTPNPGEGIAAARYWREILVGALQNELPVDHVRELLRLYREQCPEGR